MKGFGLRNGRSGLPGEGNQLDSSSVPSKSNCGIIQAKITSLTHRVFMLFHKRGGDPRATFQESRGKAPGEYKRHSKDYYG